MFNADFMQRALIAAMIVGAMAPLIGVFLVQRRLALLGDGMGHIALTGVGISFLTGTGPVATALVVAVAGAVLIEVIRTRSRAAGDLALALLFYGGIAGGVLLASLAGGRGSTSLNAYLFGSISTVTHTDLYILGGTTAVSALVMLVFAPEFLSISIDSDNAVIAGIRVRVIGTLLAALAAVTVVVGMRVVGLLLVSAIMIVPVAAAQQWADSFRTTAIAAVVIGLAATVSGLAVSSYTPVPPGPASVLFALGVFIIAALTRTAMRAIRQRGRT